jgi:hypothetical protein
MTCIKINGLKCGQKMSKSTAVLHLQYEAWVRHGNFFTNRQLCCNMKDTPHTDITPMTMERSPSKAFMTIHFLQFILRLHKKIKLSVRVMICRGNFKRRLKTQKELQYSKSNLTAFSLFLITFRTT